MPGPTSDTKRRQHILKCAERLFQHYGFGKTTVADIAREAKVGVGTVYLEFASKEDIVAELSVQRLERVLDAMREAAAADGPHAERLTAMLDARMKAMAQFARQGQHGADLLRCACPATEEAHQRFRAQEEDLLTEFLDLATQEGELDVPEPRDTARVLMRLYDSYSPMAAAELGEKQVRREIAVAHALVRRALARRSQ